MKQKRWTVKVLLSTALAVGLVGSVTTPVQAAAPGLDTSVESPDSDNPDADTDIKPGGAYMGWNDEGTSSTTGKGSLAAGTTGSASTKGMGTNAVVYGIDVSGWQGNVDWNYWWNQGMRFAYVKATEGTYYKNDYFTQQYNGSYNKGFIRGSYHFARPDTTSGAAQAEYFVARGGGWSKDGKTLPGVLDIEFNPYGANCYGLSDAGMVNWISSFTNRYKQLTGRDAVIYTNTNWWKDCTGNSSKFGSTNPLWVANYGDSTPPLPAGWGYYTIHQYTSSPLDKNKFNGSYDRLKALANG